MMSCSTCAFFIVGTAEGFADVFGRCRRYPPHISQQCTQMPMLSSCGRSPAGLADHPIVIVSDWCGEWKATA